jgi:hypothetical protein
MYRVGRAISRSQQNSPNTINLGFSNTCGDTAVSEAGSYTQMKMKRKMKRKRRRL